MTAADLEHFRGCHPEEDRAAEDHEGPADQPVEDCWHCGTQTPRGCGCADCWLSADDIPPAAVYHCPLCGRWWAYMRLSITSFTFNPEGE
jgi:hypothetical protein